jgi:hypothetical protein
MYITGIPTCSKFKKSGPGSQLLWMFYNTFWRYLAVLTVNINFFRKSESMVQLFAAVCVRKKYNFCQNKDLFFMIIFHDYRSRLHQTLILAHNASFCY